MRVILLSYTIAPVARLRQRPSHCEGEAGDYHIPANVNAERIKRRNSSFGSSGERAKTVAVFRCTE
jgi:hypothetical protein